MFLILAIDLDVEIDFFLTNSALSFQHTLTQSCGLSDFHEVVI